MSYHYIEEGPADPVQEEDLLEFRLLYQGVLHPSANDNPRAGEKHSIRRSLHPQLRRLWKMQPTLRHMARHIGTQEATKVTPMPELNNEEQTIDFGIKAIGQQWQRVGYDFVPLVTDSAAVRCSLDILLLRPEEDRFIFTQGDIDGQLKTIFDALKIPASSKEAGKIGPQEDETPFFVLLENDRLISEVRVNADQLLLLPNTRDTKPHDAFVTIHVRLNYKSPRTFDRWLD
ncbi:MAG TPA: hypothetical protein VHZ07_20495 [Bryobacteraceae bacterium]|jgi:hypothetical protein|nr:hypothetical protein [Bryobacteraceae bacterium]